MPEAESVEPILVDRTAGIGWIRLNRPRQINALSLALRSDFCTALAELQADRDVHVIVISGNGERGFCAGADIKEFAEVHSLTEARQARAVVSWSAAMERVTKPIIAAIHGYCLGGGLEIALGCDIRMASPDAVFGLPEITLGQIPGGGGTQRLARIIGLGRAMDMVLTAERMSALEAKSCGLVTRVSESRDALEYDVRTLASALASRGSAALAFAKEATKASTDVDLPSGLRLEGDLFTLLMSTPERMAAAKAFQNKSNRAPLPPTAAVAGG